MKTLLKKIVFPTMTAWHRFVLRRTYRFVRSKPSPRQLEIGPGFEKIVGFETLNITWRPGINYVADAAKPLPFDDNTFDLIYASHILEHVPWYQTQGVLADWTRILKRGGRLEVWVPDGLKICTTLIDAETKHIDNTHLDNWYRFNPEKDPCLWAAGRIFTYGDGTGKANDPNWHRAIFTPRLLKELLMKVGLADIRPLGPDDIRGHDHGWINLGFGGTKA